MTNTVNIRELILGTLIEVTQKEAYSHIAIRNVLDKYQYLEKQERAFFTRVCEGTLEQLIFLDYVINQFSTVKVNKMKPVIRNILRMTVYQLKFMDRVPVSAACNEAVKLAQKKGFSSLKGFVNGVLRNISRNIEQITYPKREESVANYLSICYAMPLWIVENWLTVYEEDMVESLLQGFLEEKKTTIRFNPEKITKENLVKSLEEEGILVEDCPYLSYALFLSNYDSIGRIEGFQKGLFYIQDISSMLVAEVANPKEGDYIIDVCAAPGGKSLHLAEKLNGTGLVEARDLTPYKVNLLKENIERFGLKNIKAVQQDVLEQIQPIEEANIVIADLPCSGLGIMGKKTDIKHKITLEKIVDLQKLQREILAVVWQYVRVGGTLIYSTCTISEKENEENIKWFLENYPFELEEVDSYLCNDLKSSTTKQGYLQMLPGVHKTDGFFLARLIRKG